MKNFLLSLLDGVTQESVSPPFLPHFHALLALKALSSKNGLFVLDASHLVGKIDVAMNGTGFLTSLVPTRSKDIIIEASGLKGAMRGDLVVAKRTPNKRGGRAKAVVVYIASRAFAKSIVYTKMHKGKVVGANIKNESILEMPASQKSLKQLPLGSVLKIDNLSSAIEEVLGVGGNDTYAYFQFGIDESTKQKIEDLINQRNEAKKIKDFETADKIRDELTSMEISLMDTPNGTVWEKL